MKMQLQIAVAITAAILFAIASCEHAPVKEEIKKPSEKAFVKKTQFPPKKPKEEKSFMSTLTGWLFPFGSSDEEDSTPAEGRHAPVQYLPPTNKKPFKKDCNPCNDEPWVPIAGTYRDKTVINFAPPSSQYGPPNTPAVQYGSPAITQQYGPPPVKDIFHPPPLEQYGPPPRDQYGPPPPAPQINHQYGVPQQQEFKDQYGPPPSNQYGSPPRDQYGPPPAPQINDQYGAPQQQEFKDQYGPPPSDQYGPPQQLKGEIFQAPPAVQYGPPAQINNQYGTPPKDELYPPLDQLYVPPLLNSYGTPVKEQLGSHSEPALSKRPSREQQSRFETPKEYMSPPPLPVKNYKTPATTKLHKIPPLKYPAFPTLQLEQIPPHPNGPQVFNHYFPPKGIQQNIVFDSPPIFGPPLRPIPLDRFKFPPHKGAPQKIIPLPNLSHKPVLPLRNPVDFHQGFQINDNIHQGTHSQQQRPPHIATDIQIVPSIPVAGYTASIEYPVNVIQSPLLEVPVKSQEPAGQEEQHSLKENPIVVPDHDDVAPAESIHNDTYDNKNNNKRGNDQDLGIISFDTSNRLNTNAPQKEFLKGTTEVIHPSTSTTSAPISDLPPPVVDFSNWKPTFGSSLPTSMVPPPMSESWYYTRPITTPKPKPLQVIVPYLTNNPPSQFRPNQGRKVPPKEEAYQQLSMFTRLPSREEPVWGKYVTKDFYQSAESEQMTRRPAANIRDLLKGEMEVVRNDSNLPFDVLTLQKYIDDWTQQEYSNQLSVGDGFKSSTSGKLAPSKNIPSGFLTTVPYNVTSSVETTTVSGSYDHFASGSDQKEEQVPFGDVAENSLTGTGEGVTEVVEDIEQTTSTVINVEVETTTVWDESNVEISPKGKEKVYIVTPVTVEKNNKKLKKASFAIRIESGNETINGQKNSSTVIYSEWPHIINSLETTRTPRHPLLGLMDLTAYTPPPNATVQTYSGHSKVVTVVTPLPADKGLGDGAT